MTRISPQPSGRELRTFECKKCGYVEQYSVAYGSSAPWVLVGPQRR
ncbi:hypothetical protein HNR60_004557 [Rhodopseudomonas rhenobacensis]|uniref:Uncharacterized protein n=1 Tax=Rhodopseudomonas rhenobacensis TaxID=87461 RepID=A0A7W8E142_9BRAD|nr:hypothetical protein [Rhodopseudomonas rhenobacensis]MBB5049773.1 hypothetical protein [Rhodopseudomonas rhenobacensis]